MATANSNAFDVRVNSPTPLAVAAAGMAPGSWATFGCNFSTGSLISLLDVTVTAQKLCAEFADKMAWDSSRRQIYFTGGGHGQDCKTIVYNDDTNTWTDLGRPPWYRVNPSGATHGYQHNAFQGGTHYFLQYGTWTIRTRDVTQGNSSWGSFMGPNSYGGFATGALEWFPTFGAGGSLIVVQGFGAGTGIVERYNGGTWSHLADKTMGDYHNFAVYSPVRDIMYFGGGQGSNAKKVWKMSNTGTITACADCPANLGIIQSVTTVDPGSGNLLAITRDHVVRIYDPGQNAWSIDSNAPDSGFWSGSVYGVGYDLMNICAAPIPDYKVTMFLVMGPSANATQLYLLKGR